jgi:hypothetical protein
MAAAPSAFAFLSAGVAYYWPRFGWLMVWTVLVSLAGVAGLFALDSIESSHPSSASLSGMQVYLWGTIAQLAIGLVGVIAVPLERRGARRDAGERSYAGVPIAGAFTDE